MQTRRPPKLDSALLMKKLAELPIRYSSHALLRLGEREILQVSVSRMLRGQTKSRFHAPSKDQFEKGSWKYRIHGTGVDDEKIAVAVVVEELVIVVTVFDRE